MHSLRRTNSLGTFARSGATAAIFARGTSANAGRWSVRGSWVTSEEGDICELCDAESCFQLDWESRRECWAGKGWAGMGCAANIVLVSRCAGFEAAADECKVVV